MEPEQPLSSERQPWQEALSPRLVARLSRPLLQPGVLAPGFSRSIISRMQHTGTPMPLLEKLLRYTQVGESRPVLPLVYPQPWPPVGPDHADVPAPPTGVRPVVQAMAMRPAENTRAISAPAALPAPPIVRARPAPQETAPNHAASGAQPEHGELPRVGPVFRPTAEQTLTAEASPPPAEGPAPERFVLPAGRRLRRAPEADAAASTIQRAPTPEMRIGQGGPEALAEPLRALSSPLPLAGPAREEQPAAQALPLGPAQRAGERLQPSELPLSHPGRAGQAERASPLVSDAPASAGASLARPLVQAAPQLPPQGEHGLPSGFPLSHPGRAGQAERASPLASDAPASAGASLARPLVQAAPQLPPQGEHGLPSGFPLSYPGRAGQAERASPLASDAPASAGVGRALPLVQAAPLSGAGESSPATRLGQALRGAAQLPLARATVGSALSEAARGAQGEILQQSAAYADPGGAGSPAQPVVRPTGVAPAPGELVQRRPAADAVARPVVAATRVAPSPEAPPLVLPRRAEGSPAGPLPDKALSAAPSMLARAQDELEASGAPADPAPPSQPPTAGAADADELAERVMRKLMRQITIESERRGRRP